MENFKPESKITPKAEKNRLSVNSPEHIRSPKLQMADRFIGRLFRKYEHEWKNQNGFLDSDSTNIIKLLKEDYEQGDYSLVVGQLLLEKESLEEQKEKYIQKDEIETFEVEKRNLMETGSILAQSMFPEIKDITLDYVGEYFANKVSERRATARNLRSKTELEERKQYEKQTESFDNVSSIIYDGSEADIEDYKKAIDVVNKEIGEKENYLTSTYTSIVNNEKLRKTNEKDSHYFIDFKKEIAILFKLKKALEIVERKIYGSSETKPEQQKIDKLRSELANKEKEEIMPHLLSPRDKGEVFSKFFEREGMGYEPKKDVMKIPFSEADKRNYLAHVLGVIQQAKIELNKLKEKGNNNVRLPATVVGVLGNGGIDVGILQILLTKKRGYVQGHIKFEKVLALDLREAIKEAVDYEIKDPDWENYFS